MMVALVASGVAFVVSTPVFAQERAASKPWSLRDMLFFSRKQPRLEPQEKVRKGKARVKNSKQRKARQAAEPPVVVIDKLPDAKVVLVLGDFVGAGTAEGLNAVFASNPRVRIVDRSNGSSGFVRPDHFDWPGKVAELIAAEKPSVVIFAVGANDRQQMRVDGTREVVRSEKWTAEYTVRVQNFAKTASGTRVPFVWMGTPAFKSPKMNSDMLAFNEIYRSATTEVSGEFVDVWDGFVDETGAFVTTGPDINGQPVRLRAGDGINFTTAGKRKLAFYTEKSLKKILGEVGAAGVSPLPSAGLTGPTDAPVNPGEIERTVPVSLTDPVLDGGGELMGLEVQTRTSPRSPGEKLMLDGIAPDPAPGRADDFSQPGRPAAPVTVLAPPITEETTTAIRN